MIAWSFDGVDDDGSIDGMLTLDRPARADATTPTTAPQRQRPRRQATAATSHPNGVTGIDHVVVMTDDARSHQRRPACVRLRTPPTPCRPEERSTPVADLLVGRRPVIIELVRARHRHGQRTGEHLGSRPHHRRPRRRCRPPR
ncbi:MAG: hypothetical protein R2710_10990 [Acidimicrobiales bacterium]